MTNKKKLDSSKGINETRSSINLEKTAEERKIADETFRQFFENEPEYSYIVSTEGLISNINRAALNVLGYRKKELVGKDMRTIYAPESLPKMKKLFSRWKKTGHLENEEMTIITKKGDRRIVLLSANAMRDRDGKIQYSVSTQRDITKRKQVEKALQESKERFKVMFESSHDLISLADDKGKTIWANPTWKKTLGYTPKTHGDPMDKIHPDDRPHVLKAWEAFKHDKSAFTNVEYRYKTASGDYVFLEATIRPLLVAGKNRLFVAAHNITERKKAEEQKVSFLYDLGERIKELNCLYGLSKLVERSNVSLEEIYQGAADLIPPSWQFPAITCARIVIYGKEFKTPNFKESKFKQSADIRVYRKKAGAIEIYYLKKKPDIDEGPFLKEERDLLDAIAERLGRITEHKKGEEALRLSEERYILAQGAANIGSWDWNILTGNLVWSDTIESLFGFSKGKFGGTYEAFLDCVHPEDRQFVIDSVDACVEHGKDYAIEHRIIWPDGTVHWVSETGDVIRNEKGKATRMLGIVQDITDRKNMEAELQKSHDRLEEQVEERTSQLADANKKLIDEITERKKAERKAIETKEYLQNVINSASEIVISFDINNRVTTWNKTAELLTGFKQKEIINRSVNKLLVFDNSQNLLDDIKSVLNNKKLAYDDLVLTTKDNNKKIIRVSGSSIRDDNKICIGSLFIGKDITQDIEIHGKLLKGNGYLIPDKNNMSAVDLLIDLATSGSNGLFITRANPEMIKSIIPSSNIQVVLLSQEKLSGFENISDPDALIKKIEEFSAKNKESIILLDGIHYLLTRFSFDKFIETLYQINEMMIKNKSILFIRLDPSLVDTNQLAIIRNELQLLPSQKIDGLIIEDVVYDILKFIHEQNQNNVLVSFKKIMAKFNIAYVTAAKRLETLEDKGLIFTKRHGKLRTVYISERGKTFLHKRQTA